MTSFTAAPLTRVQCHLALLAAVLALALYRFFILDSSDRFRCNALLHSGRWLDGNFTKWQPDGCMLYPYKPATVSQCLKDGRVVFIGDSTVRSLFYESVALVDPAVDITGEKHSNRAITAGGIRWEFYWDPYLDSQTWTDLLAAKQGKTGPPALLVAGTGLWHLRLGKLNGFTTALDRLFTAVSGKSARANPIADEVVLLPVSVPEEELLSPARKTTLTRTAVAKLNADIRTRLDASSEIYLAYPSVYNDMLVGATSLTSDGLHYERRMSKIQAQILANLRCNDMLLKTFPLDKTCCSQYPSPNWVQIIFLVLLIGWAPLAMHLGQQSPFAHWFPASEYLLPMTIFGFIVSLLFFGDRTSLFLKEGKYYDPIQFAVLSLAALGAGIFTMKKPDKGDLGFLNRDQTDEWKGWMQVAILIYHYIGASGVSGIYNPIRVCVAAYLFMSGYGHFFFYYKKADYSFSRIFAVLVRLNLLTLVLAYVMDTDYLSYYFSPLVSMWFIIIWVTMWAGRQWNHRVFFVVPKLIVSAAVVATFFHHERPLAFTFSIINSIFKTEWFAKEWAFRVVLDMYIVYWGMLAALVFIKFKEMKVTESPSWPQLYNFGIITSVISMVWFFGFELTRESKVVYNRSHPYMSFIPVIAFAILRNATPYLRSTSSRFFIYFGQCSLETFIIQFHFWLGADTKGLLMVVPFTRWRITNFIISSLIFVFISNQVAQATSKLTDWLCNKSSTKLPTSVAPAAGDSNADHHHNTAGSSQGTPEYVALSTGSSSSSGTLGKKSGAHEVQEKGEMEESGMDTVHSTTTLTGEHGLSQVGRIVQLAMKWINQDLRLKTAFLLISMWILNLVYPGHVAQGHVLPTH